jgi:hypothetical protein
MAHEDGQLPAAGTDTRTDLERRKGGGGIKGGTGQENKSRVIYERLKKEVPPTPVHHWSTWVAKPQI